MRRGCRTAGIQLQVTHRIRLHDVMAEREYSKDDPVLSNVGYGADALLVLICLALLHGHFLLLLSLQD